MQTKDIPGSPVTISYRTVSRAVVVLALLVGLLTGWFLYGRNAKRERDACVRSGGAYVRSQCLEPHPTRLNG